MPDGKLGSSACLASLSLDIDNEQGRPLFQESQKFETNARLSAQALFVPNFRFFRGGSPWTQLRARILFLADVSVETT
jgi:hypothetical protein